MIRLTHWRHQSIFSCTISNLRLLTLALQAKSSEAKDKTAAFGDDDSSSDSDKPPETANLNFVTHVNNHVEKDLIVADLFRYFVICPGLVRRHALVACRSVLTPGDLGHGELPQWDWVVWIASRVKRPTAFVLRVAAEDVLRTACWRRGAEKYFTVLFVLLLILWWFIRL